MHKQNIIVGGGIAGLSLAQQLDPAHTLIIERQQLQNRGAGILLSVNATQHLKAMGILEPLQAWGQIITKMQISDAKGKQLSSLDMNKLAGETGLPTLGIHRQDLHQILQQQVRCKQLFDVDVQHITQHSDHFQLDTNQGTLTSNQLIGADGIHSQIRKQFFQSQFRYAGYTCWRGVVELPQIAKSQRLLEMWGHGKRFGYLPVNKQQVYFFATLNAEANAPQWQNIAIDDFKQCFREFGADVPAILEQLDQQSSLIHNDLGDLSTVCYGRGNLFLIGDAAHAMTPNLGQGAAQAIEDATALAPLLQAQTEQAQLRYQQQRSKRAEHFLKQSYQMGRLAQWQHPLACYIRNTLLRLSPDRMTINNMQRKLLNTQ